MKTQKKQLILCILIPLAVGGLSALFSGGGMEIFNSLDMPSLSPPAWLFPVVWTVLYILMGIASYLVLTSGKENKAALIFYAAQLFFNFFWSIIFFSFQAYLFAFVWLVILWILIFICTVLFYDISKPAGFLMLFYLLWVTFAGYLNLSVYLLN